MAVLLGAAMKIRGVHFCDLCETPQTSYAERDGRKLLLGHAEIRVVSAESNLSSSRKALEGAESRGLIPLQRSPAPFSIYAFTDPSLC